MNVQPWRELRQGDEGPAVKGMQYLLRGHGSDIAPDGLFGPLTAGAVTQFQTARGLPEDGFAGPVTWQQLVVVTRTGDVGEAVKGVQSFGLAGFPIGDPLVVDGIYGPKTESGVLSFQQQWGLTPDGVAGPETWSYLGADGATVWPLVKEGDAGYRVLPVQHLLRARGFDIAADGVYGPQTGEAVRQFDSSNRAVFVSDVVGSLTWPTLVIQVGQGDSGEAVRAVQSLFPSLVQDGDFGPLTAGAVEGFQQMFGLTVDGIVGPRTWRALVLPKAE